VCGVARGAWGCEVTAARRLPIIADDRPGVARVRARTINIRRLAKRDLERGALLYPERPGVDYLRPATFEECDSVGLGDLTPCPFVSCKHHLYLDVNERLGSIKLNFPDRDPDEIGETCSKRVEMRGGVTLDAVADAINTTRERVRQIESRALAKLRAAGLAPELLEDLAEIVECRDVREDAR